MTLIAFRLSERRGPYQRFSLETESKIRSVLTQRLNFLSFLPLLSTFIKLSPTSHSSGPLIFLWNFLAFRIKHLNNTGTNHVTWFTYQSIIRCSSREIQDAHLTKIKVMPWQSRGNLCQIICRFVDF